MKIFSRFGLVGTVTATTILILMASLGAVSWVISGSIAARIGEQAIAGQNTSLRTAATIVEREGLKQTSDTGAIEAAVDAVLAGNADKVAEYQGGKEALFGFFVGQTMKAMQGKGNPGLVNQVLKQKLAN